MTQQTITITFGDVAENHVGMQQIGQMSDKGYSLIDLLMIKKWFDNKDASTKIYDLKPLSGVGTSIDTNPNVDDGHILVIKSAVDHMLGSNSAADRLYQEQKALEWDTKALMYGREVNKRARYNLCYSDKHQEPDYTSGKGRVYAFNEVPILNHIRQMLGMITNDKKPLQAEGNNYYDIKKCGIGFHGDAERTKVIAIRLGTAMPIYYQWYKNSKPVGSLIDIDLDHGDMYVMSEKATGHDWKLRSKYTLRHATGSKKYTTPIV